jgi:hypothetical protein
MADGVLSVKAGKVIQQMTLRVDVRGLRVLKIRMAVGLLLVRAACLVIGCGIKVDRDA